MQEVRALSRAGRHNQILLYLGERVRKQLGNGATAYAIAKAIGMRPQSPAFRQHLKSMVDEGKLIAEDRTMPGRWAGKWYSLPEATVKSYAPKARVVVEKKTSKNTMQLKLF